MGTGGVAAIVVVAAALGVLAGAKLFGGSAVPPVEGVPPTVAEARVRDATLRAHAELKDESAKLRAALEAEKFERTKAAQRAEAAEAALAASRKEAEEAKAALEARKPSPTAAGAPRFSFGEYDEALGKVDWKSVGDNTHAMVPLIGKLRDAAGKTDPPDLSSLGAIQKHNASLIEAASKIAGKIPGSSVNGSFTHPAFMANSIAATLDAAGLPLSETQTEALGKIGREFSDRDRARIAAYDDRTWELQRVLEEADLRDRFVEAAFLLLTPDQRNALTPEPVKGLLGFDLYSSGLVLATHLAPVGAKGRDDYAEKVAQNLTTRSGVAAERKEDLRKMVAEWAAGLPEEWFDRELPRTVGQPLIPVTLVMDAGRRELALFQKAANDLALADDKVQALRRVGYVLLPLIDKDE